MELIYSVGFWSVCHGPNEKQCNVNWLSWLVHCCSNAELCEM